MSQAIRYASELDSPAERNRRIAELAARFKREEPRREATSLPREQPLKKPRGRDYVAEVRGALIALKDRGERATIVLICKEIHASNFKVNQAVKVLRERRELPPSCTPIARPTHAQRERADA